MSPPDCPTLNCQDCGRIVMELTHAEARRVAERPYDFIVYCSECRLERMVQVRAGGPEAATLRRGTSFRMTDRVTVVR
jgi:RNase P subunit RPR2